MIHTYNISDFPSFQSIENQFMLERFENLQRPPKMQWPHKHGFFEILWLTSGKSVNVIDYHQFMIEPNMLFFISPGQLHLMSNAEDVKGYSITFTEEFLLMNSGNKDLLLELNFLDNSYFDPALRLDNKSSAELYPVLEIMLYETSRAEKSAVIIGRLLQILLSKIQRIISIGHPQSLDLLATVKFKNFRQQVERNYKKETSLTFYANELNIGTHRLNEICKLVTGKTAGGIIRDRTLLEAKRLLLH